MKRRSLHWNCFVLIFCLLCGYLAFGAPASTHGNETAKKEAEAGKADKNASKSDEEADKSDKETAKSEKADKETAKSEKADKETAKSDKEEQKSTKTETAPGKTDKESAKSEKKSEGLPPPTVKVKKGPFRVELTLDGIFEAQSATEIILRPQEWSGLTVLSGVELGATVKRGDLLLSLELDKIDRAIADVRTELELGDLSIQQAEQTVRALEGTVPLDLAANQRAQRNAADDLKYFVEVARPMLVRTLDFMLKSTKHYLENQQEEYGQLEKMYKADDITEETEKIVLRRAQHAVEAAQFSVDRMSLEHDRELKVDLPRMDDRINDAARRTDLASERDKVVLPLTLKKQQLDLEKLKITKARGEERLSKLLADRAMMTVKAPCDGVVYYGKCTRGRWSGMGSAGDEFRRGASVQANAVIMTIVEPRPMFVRATIAEKDLHRVRAGITGTATPTGFPDLKLAAILERVAAIPLSSGGFDARLTVAFDDKGAELMPGMSCQVKLVPYQTKEAIVVPPTAVAEDETDPQKHFVYALSKEGKPEKRDVTVGKRSDKQVEILKGLAEGDAVLIDAPKEKK